MFQECSEADHKVHYWRKVRREEGGRKGGRRREEEGEKKARERREGGGRGWEGGERIKSREGGHPEKIF